MVLVVTGLVGILLLATTVLIHYEMLRLASGMSVGCGSFPPQARVLIVIAVVLVAHLAEIGLYAIAFLACEAFSQLGRLVGELEGAVIDSLYVSISNYTTLGIGDVHVSGPLRLIAGLEALNGLVLIGWSASFTYLTMQENWDRHAGKENESQRRDHQRRQGSSSQ
jgi:hypothetical protein